MRTRSLSAEKRAPNGENYRGSFKNRVFKSRRTGEGERIEENDD